MKFNFNEKWALMSPAEKRRYIMFGVIGGVILFSLVVALSAGSKKKKETIKTTPESTVMLPQRKDVNAEMLAAELTALQRQVENIDSNMRAMDAKQGQQGDKIKADVATLAKGQNEGLSQQLTQMQERLDQMERNTVNPPIRESVKFAGPSGDAPKPIMPSAAMKQAATKLGGNGPTLNSPLPDGGQVFTPSGANSTGEGSNGSPTITGQAAVQNKDATVTHKLRLGGDSGNGEKLASNVTMTPGSGTAAAGNELASPTKAGGTKDPKVTAQDASPSSKAASSGNGINGGSGAYLSSGSILQGVLLTGMDAPTSTVAVKNPTPALVRIKELSILPNFRKADIRECFILISGYGVMSTERAMLRTENISCVRTDGKVIDSPIEGFVVGDDGKAGMRGRLVSKQGSVIAKSMVAGFFGGVSDALKPQSVLNLNTGTATNKTTQPELGDVFTAGSYNGAAGGMKSVAEFYIAMAKEMFPVVEIDAGRKIEIVLVRGARLVTDAAKD